MTTRVIREARRAAKQGKYTGYMPEGLPQHRPKQRFKPWWKVLGKPRVTLYPKEEIEGFSDEPEYPPLNDIGRKAIRDQVRLDWYESLKSLPTSEAKLHEIGRHCTHYVAHINNFLPNYNSLPMIQYMTQTNFINELPEQYKPSTVNDSGKDNSTEPRVINSVKDIVLNQIALEKYHSSKKAPFFVSPTIRDGNRKSYESHRSIQNLVSNVKNFVAAELNKELLDYKIDLSPAVRSWWYHSGFKAPNEKPYFRSRKDDDGKINQMIQMDGSSALNYRCDNLIAPIVSQTDPLVADTTLVHEYCHPLREFGAQFKFKWPVTLPGYWQEEQEDELKYDFPHTCFLSLDCLQLRNQKAHTVTKSASDEENCLNGQAILTAFGWLNSLSMYHGYTPFQELDYPFTCQVIATDGQNWQFNVYQLNTHTFHRDLGGPKKNNLCWSSGKMQLYHDYVNGQFVGVNDEVVRLVVRFLTQKTSPQFTAELNPRPYLSYDERTDEEKEKTRKALRRQFECRTNNLTQALWYVPLYEHLFFRSKEGRNRITHMKPRWHPPKPKTPKIFE